MRNVSIVKFNRAREANAQRVGFPMQKADIAYVLRDIISATGVFLRDCAGKIYWVEISATGASASAILHDNGAAAAGNKICSRAIATDKDGRSINFDPPAEFEKGVYATITTADVKIAYELFGKNLVCKVNVTLAPGTSNLVSRVSVFRNSSDDLVSRLTVLKESSTDLVSRVISLVESSSDLVSRLIVRANSSDDLVAKVTVVYAATSKDLTARVTVLNESSSNLVSRVTVDYSGQVRYLVSRVTVIGIGSKGLLSRVNVTSP